jgi:hypothetical protein
MGGTEVWVAEEGGDVCGGEDDCILDLNVGDSGRRSCSDDCAVLRWCNDECRRWRRVGV